MRKWLIRLGVLALLVAAAVALRLTLLAPERLAVKVVAVARGVVEQTVTNSRAGTVKARLRAHLSPEIGGRIAQLPHREGDRVHAGDLLLRVDDTSLRAQLHFAQRESEAAATRRVWRPTTPGGSWRAIATRRRTRSSPARSATYAAPSMSRLYRGVWTCHPRQGVPRVTRPPCVSRDFKVLHGDTRGLGRDKPANMAVPLRSTLAKYLFFRLQPLARLLRHVQESILSLARGP